MALTLAQARAMWHRRQGLAKPVAADPVEVVRATGWVRTLGGIDAYLALAPLAYVREAALAELGGGVAEPETSVSLLAMQDNYLVLHGRTASVTDPAHHRRPVKAWAGRKAESLGTAKTVFQRTVACGELVCGTWEHDPDAGEVLWEMFDRAAEPWASRIAAEAERTAAFIRDELGHARSFSLDKDEAVRERARALRERLDGR